MSRYCSHASSARTRDISLGCAACLNYFVSLAVTCACSHSLLISLGNPFGRTHAIRLAPDDAGFPFLVPVSRAHFNQPTAFESVLPSAMRIAAGYVSGAGFHRRVAVLSGERLSEDHHAYTQALNQSPSLRSVTSVSLTETDTLFRRHHPKFSARLSEPSRRSVAAFWFQAFSYRDYSHAARAGVTASMPLNAIPHGCGLAWRNSVPSLRLPHHSFRPQQARQVSRRVRYSVPVYSGPSQGCLLRGCYG